MEHVVAGAGGAVFEVDVLEFDPAAALGQLTAAAVGGVGNVGLGLQDLGDAARAGHGAGQHKQAHTDHEHAHEHLHDVGEEGVELAGQQLAAGDEAAAEPHDAEDGGIHREHHDGADEYDAHDGGEAGVAQLVVGFLELFPLKVAAHEGLDHADADEVFLHRVVQGVYLLLEAGEKPLAGTHDEP